MLKFTGERIVPGAPDCEPTFAQKMYQEHLARYAFAAAFAPGADVLDVGCGVGYGSQWLANAGAKSVVGIDIATDAIAHAKKTYFHASTSFKVCSASAFNFPKRFDLVTCFELIEHVEEQAEVLDNIAEALRDDGVLVISTPKPHDENRTHFHHRELEFEELYALLKDRFRTVRPYFENNYFTSFIGPEQPSIVRNIIPVTDNFGLLSADYFVFVATNGDADRLDAVQPVLTMNDDSYVLTLEHDVGVLHRAEDDLKARIADQEREKAELRGAQEAATGALDQRIAELRDVEAALARLETDISVLRGAERDHLARIADQDREKAELRAAQNASVIDLDRRSAELRESIAREQAAHETALRLNEAIDDLRRAEEGAQAKLADLQREGVELRAAWDAAVLSYEEAREREMGVSAALDAARANTTRLEDERDTIRAANEGANNRVALLEQDADGAAAAVSALRAELDIKRAELTQSSELEVDARRRVEQLEAELRDREQALFSERERSDALAVGLANSGAAMDGLRGDVARQAAKVAELQIELHHREAKSDELVASRAWAIAKRVDAMTDVLARRVRNDKARRLGDQARDQRDWPAASDYYSTYLQAYPEAFAIWVQLGHAFKERGQTDRALAAYNTAYGLNPSDADLLLNLGHLYNRAGDRDRAVSFYRRSAELDGNAHASLELERMGEGHGYGAPGGSRAQPEGSLALAAGPSAVLWLDRIVDPKGRRHWRLGDAARDRGDWRAAADHYRHHLLRRPANFSIWVQFGHALKESDQLDKALNAYGRAFRLRPSDADLLLNIGHLHKVVGRRENAVAFYRLSAQIDSNLDALTELAHLGAGQRPVTGPAPGVPVEPPLAATRPPEPDNAPDAIEQPDILFIIGCWEGESKRYRVYNLIEGLDAFGYTSKTADAGQGRKIIHENIIPKVAVFFRAPFDPSHGLVELLEYFKNNHVTTVFDVDDYIFEPGIIDGIAGVADLDDRQRKDYEWGVRAYRSLLFSCERATVSTAFLADRMREMGREVAVVPNTINAQQIEHARQLLAQAQPLSGGVVRICYLSGTRTHSLDFQESAAALQAILSKNSNVVFRLVGYLDLDSSWEEFSDRVERVGFLPPLDMMSNLAECDINLAPLEEGNVFCEGKSELKFFEAGIVRVPTVASRTISYAAAITDGVDGVLASDPNEWEAKLQALVDSPELRRQLGAQAEKTALSNFNTGVAARAALLAYGLEADDRIEIEVKRNKRLKIGWIIPGLIIGGGGHRNILRAAYHLERFGHEVSLYFSDTTMTEGQLRRSIRQHFYPFNGSVRRFDGQVNGEDVLMATHWSTVSLAESVRNQIGEIMYFVQDFEPAFYPMGSEYILAENTYRKGLYGISSGPWCERLLRDRYHMEVDHFRFPIDRDIYHANHGGNRANRLLFFAKPEMARRCFLIGVEALRELHRLKPELEIMFYGSSAARDYGLDYPVTFCGVLPGIDDLAKLYATSTIGLVFSTTNPSLVPYEMMACGLPVVDIGVPGNEVNYGDRDDIALLADPDPRAMAQNIASLLDDRRELEARRERGISFVASLPTEQQMAERIEQLILDRVKVGPTSRGEVTARGVGRRKVHA